MTKITDKSGHPRPSKSPIRLQWMPGKPTGRQETPKKPGATYMAKPTALTDYHHQNRATHQTPTHEMIHTWQITGSNTDENPLGK